jgi:hypothetical protein
MTLPPRAIIGFDRMVAIEWLDAAAGRLAMGQSEESVRRYLWSLLGDVVSGETVHSARGKTLTVLARIWLTVPVQATPLRDQALRCIPAVTTEERIALHWAMSVASYPFFFDVAQNVGKLLALHGSASSSQVARRMIETWGDRSTLPRAIQRVLRSMIQWGGLREGTERGALVAPAQRIRICDGVAELLVEALLVSLGCGMGFSRATNHPALFPFVLHMDASALRKSRRVRVFRQGDQTDFLELTRA